MTRPGGEITVGIVGGGPSGLLLAHVLGMHGIDSVVLERASRPHVEARIRAGQLDHDAVRYLIEVGVADRLQREGIPQRGFNLRFGGQSLRIDLEELTGGRYCTVYGQAELTKDLIARRQADGHPPIFEAEVLSIRLADDGPQQISYRHAGAEHVLRCRYVVGCDGYFGVTRKVVAEHAGPGVETQLPHAWYGIFTRTPPIFGELSYIYHRNGFALCSMRSSELSRIYLQCDPDARVDDWDDDRFWSELFVRIGAEWAARFQPGPTLERTVVKLRSYVSARMRVGNVFLAGDAAHIVPPSAAKGLNLAIGDVRRLAQGFVRQLQGNDPAGLASYSQDALRRVWAMQDFSWLMTDLLHSAADRDPFIDRLKIARLENLVNSPVSLRSFANQYVGYER